jgi:secondary thiamine-phosphate synthase enzyme
MQETFIVETVEAKQCVDITARVETIVERSGVTDGFCLVMVLHSTAAIVVNENDDPNIGVDVLTALDRAVPDHAGWLHDRVDDNAHSHIKASILGPSELIPVRGGELLLGRWQGVMLFEFDGPRKRQISVSLMSAA